MCSFKHNLQRYYKEYDSYRIFYKDIIWDIEKALENSYKIHIDNYSSKELGIQIWFKIHAMNVKSAKILNVKSAKILELKSAKIMKV